MKEYLLCRVTDKSKLEVVEQLSGHTAVKERVELIKKAAKATEFGSRNEDMQNTWVEFNLKGLDLFDIAKQKDYLIVPFKSIMDYENMEE